jgi:hypothetical protein
MARHGYRSGGCLPGSPSVVVVSPGWGWGVSGDMAQFRWVLTWISQRRGD